MRDIHICFAVDENYECMLVTVKSILHYLPDGLRCVFHILVDDGYSENLWASICTSYSKYDNCLFVKHEVGRLFRDERFQHEEAWLPMQTYYRLALPEILETDKCLYLDTDVICCCDITELYDVDIDNYLIAGVRAAAYINQENPEEFCRRNGLPGIDQYVNAGIILMNLLAMRDRGFFLKAQRLMREYHETQDQDIINIICYNSILHLSYRFNVASYVHDRPFDWYGPLFDIEDVKQAWATPALIHYANRRKPWNDLDVFFADRWWAECLDSPVADHFYNKSRKSIMSYAMYNRKTISESRWKREVIDRIQRAEHIYVYGAGHVAKTIIPRLKSFGIEIEFVLVTRLNEGEDNLMGVRIISEDEFEILDKLGLVIIATYNNLVSDIAFTLLKHGMNNILQLDDGEL